MRIKPSYSEEEWAACTYGLRELGQSSRVSWRFAWTLLHLTWWLHDRRMLRMANFLFVHVLWWFSPEFFHFSAEFHQWVLDQEKEVA